MPRPKFSRAKQPVRPKPAKKQRSYAKPAPEFSEISQGNSTLNTHGSSLSRHGSRTPSSQPAADTQTRRDSSAGAVVLWDQHDSQHSDGSNIHECSRTDLSEVQKTSITSEDQSTGRLQIAVEYTYPVREPVAQPHVDPRQSQDCALEVENSQFGHTVAIHEEFCQFGEDLRDSSTTSRIYREPLALASSSRNQQITVPELGQNLIFNDFISENEQTLTSSWLHDHQKNFGQLDPVKLWSMTPIPSDFDNSDAEIAPEQSVSEANFQQFQGISAARLLESLEQLQEPVLPIHPSVLPRFWSHEDFDIPEEMMICPPYSLENDVVQQEPAHANVVQVKRTKMSPLGGQPPSGEKFSKKSRLKTPEFRRQDVEFLEPTVAHGMEQDAFVEGCEQSQPLDFFSPPSPTFSCHPWQQCLLWTRIC